MADSLSPDSATTRQASSCRATVVPLRIAFSVSGSPVSGPK